MGYYRLWLALWVMVGHYRLPGGLVLNQGGPIVRGFFALSGYVIAMVLEERYADRLGLYTLLRCLRIYPAYWATLAVGVLAWTVVTLGFGQDRGPVAELLHAGLPGWQAGLLAAQQVLLLGMDVVQDQWINGHPLRGMLVLGHAWSLSVELCFYLTAPWIVRWRSGWLLALVAWTLLLHAVDPMLHRWSPSPSLLVEVGYFSMGILAWRHQKGWRPAAGTLVVLVAASLALFVALPMLTGLAGCSDAASLAWENDLLPLGAMISAPCLHRLGRGWSGDRLAGELSYSLYLVHPLSGLAVALVMHGAGEWTRFITLVLGSLVAAVCFWMAVDRPLERWRRRLAQGAPDRERVPLTLTKSQ